MQSATTADAATRTRNPSKTPKMPSKPQIPLMPAPLPSLSLDGLVAQIEHCSGLSLTYHASTRPGSGCYSIQADQLDCLSELCQYKIAYNASLRLAALKAVREAADDNRRYYSSLLTTKQAAELLGVTPGRLRAFAKSYGLVAVGSEGGKSALYDPLDIEKIRAARAS